ncbi:MAG TPA: hypothetical protein VF801_00630 [Rhodocyclaceae bacterium]
MGSSCKESFEEFLELLKRAGIEITNEPELRERLAESHRWRYAFKTLAANGRQIGIRFAASVINSAEIQRAFAEFAFPEGVQNVFSAALQADE